jgi:capsular polysaccharide biosynthesis protein
MTEIKKLNYLNSSTLFDSDDSNRDIKIYEMNNVILGGYNLNYPNCLLKECEKNYFVDPIEDKIMSLISLEKIKKIDFDNKKIKNFEKSHLFFFIYDTENYYHFIYDTLPYLVSYYELKKNYPNLKLLMSFPNSEKKSFYLFVTEFLNLLGIYSENIVIANSETLYSKIFVSTSYTNGEYPNKKPRQEIFNIYSEILKKIPKNTSLPKNIYISRRSWIHGDNTNLGTNYTTRRKLVNEDELVEFLLSIGYTEVFTENLSTIEKIQLFQNAESIVGPIGGGLCNVLFAKKETKLLTIVSPYFLDINYRFLFCLEKVNNFLFKKTNHTESSFYKKNMRVKCSEIIGEIREVKNNKIEVVYDETPLSGWSNDRNFKKTVFDTSYCTALDKGLNSEFEIDIEEFKKYFITKYLVD